MTRWELSREALDLLLAALNPDREAASREYEALRRRLIDLFTWERCSDAAHLADETLNRLARRVAEGEPIANPSRYAHGIARLVMHEAARDVQKKTAALRELGSSPKSTPEDPAALDGLHRCLAELPAEQRDLIERYYAGDRARLAESLGINVNTLRNRALRIRERLFACVTRGRDES